MTEPDKHTAVQEVESSSSQSCYEAMRTCLDGFVATDRRLLQCLNLHCRLNCTSSVIHYVMCVIQIIYVLIYLLNYINVAVLLGHLLSP